MRRPRSSASLGVASLLIGVAPGHLPSAIVSAALFGAGGMVMSASLSIWSSSVFAEQPTAGFSAALFVFGVGLVAGPAVLGALAGVHGLASSFVVAAALMLPTMVAQPRHGDRPSREAHLLNARHSEGSGQPMGEDHRAEGR